MTLSLFGLKEKWFSFQPGIEVDVGRVSAQKHIFFNKIHFISFLEPFNPKYF